jgi:hypothetical protein
MKTALRLPRELHGRLMELAQHRGRSFNSEVVQRLEQTLDDPVEPVQYELQHEVTTNRALIDALQGQKATVDMLTLLCSTVAGFANNAIALLPPEVKRQHPEAEVWSAFARGVIEGKSEALAQFIKAMQRPSVEPITPAQAVAEVDADVERFRGLTDPRYAKGLAEIDEAAARRAPRKARGNVSKK